MDAVPTAPAEGRGSLLLELRTRLRLSLASTLVSLPLAAGWLDRGAGRSIPRHFLFGAPQALPQIRRLQDYWNQAR